MKYAQCAEWPRRWDYILPLVARVDSLAPVNFFVNIGGTRLLPYMGAL